MRRMPSRIRLPKGIPDEPEGGRRLDPPRCDCGGLIRPGVVWFGESLPQGDWAAAEKAARDCRLLRVRPVIDVSGAQERHTG